MLSASSWGGQEVAWEGPAEKAAERWHHRAVPWSSLQPEGGPEGAQRCSGRAAGWKGPTGGVGWQKRGSFGWGKVCSMSPAPIAVGLYPCALQSGGTFR